MLEVVYRTARKLWPSDAGTASKQHSSKPLLSRASPAAAAARSTADAKATAALESAEMEAGQAGVLATIDGPKQRHVSISVGELSKCGISELLDVYSRGRVWVLQRENAADGTVRTVPLSELNDLAFKGRYELLSLWRSDEFPPERAVAQANISAVI